MKRIASSLSDYLGPLMHASRCRIAIALLPLLSAFTASISSAPAQDYPNRPVRFVTGSAPGSAIDVPVRLIAEGLSRIWSEQAVVVNQPGAGGAIAARSAATAAPDGYTFGVMALSAFVALPGTAENLPVAVHSGRLPWRSADVNRSCALARGKNAAGFDRARETKARRVVLRGQWHWPPDA